MDIERGCIIWDGDAWRLILIHDTTDQRLSPPISEARLRAMRAGALHSVRKMAAVLNGPLREWVAQCAPEDVQSIARSVASVPI
ncbi:MAG: hypothetical protein AAFV53_32415 [Myxococcota bacterium]